MSKDIIRMAREAGFDVVVQINAVDGSIAHLTAFEALVRADEREACLDLAESYAKNNTELRDAIRARGAK